MIITTLETAEKVPFNLDGRKMFTNEKVELVHLTLKPSEEIAPHANPFDVIFFILEGEGKIFYENESFNVRPNTSIYIERDKQRGMRNEGDSVLRVLVVKIF
jgi:mannose-6-phosphate isomerase-like protein (cupin superfamily)